MEARRGISEALQRVTIVLDSLTLMFGGFKFPVPDSGLGLKTGPKVLVPRDVEQVDVQEVPEAELRFGEFGREVEGSDGDVLFCNRRTNVGEDSVTLTTGKRDGMAVEFLDRRASSLTLTV